MLAAVGAARKLTLSKAALDSGDRGDAPVGYAVALWGLTGLFFLRVIGQVLVAFFAVRALPPMAEWYSGLLPYPILLPVQLAMLAGMAKVNGDISRGEGVMREAASEASERPAASSIFYPHVAIWRGSSTCPS